jgi:hypothetical protein
VPLSRTTLSGKRLLKENLLILVEGADLLLPDAPIHSLSDADRQRVTVCHDWFSDPGFASGGYAVILIAESRSLLHQRIARLPQVLEVELPAPDMATRLQFIQHFEKNLPKEAKLEIWSTPEELARLTAGLSLHALQQLLKGALHEKRVLSQNEVVAKVEDFIQSQVGEDVVEFKKPSHRLDDCIGFTRLKKFLREEFMPRLVASGPEAIPGAAVCGPIGGAKRFYSRRSRRTDMVVIL